MNQAVDGRGRKDQATAEIADNGNVICLDAIRGDHDEDANDHGEEEDQCPIRVEGEIFRDIDMGENC